ncbi:HAD family hydrolase [Rheinheimera riviphila]|uniref:HAD family hydrolase n=1 Tax=Rheinheimera riviphila TaxID=1834037 RepID=A0A437R5I6_9GAMM|nr:HAD-IA family hydrolase [Rheinheimera riviphila]RVU42048.1 HAD family hydrolase [Rheinheimera riviphila]
MRIYKALSPIKALSFDLDDTLYPNSDVISKAELAMQRRLRQLLGDVAYNQPDFWWQQRKMLAAVQPDIRHDVSSWRLLALEQGLVEQGISRCEAAEIAELAMTAFLAARTDIKLPAQIRPLLEQLATRFPLVAITNGNADIQQMGIGDLFQFALRAGPDGRMKPYPDLFLNAATRLQVEPCEILHIGDHIKSDVLGALHAGCQSAWLNLTPGSVKALKTLPHLEISDVLELKDL